ncbi:MAG: CinA family protein, partial [Chloroflexi bacterium]|nr:CinA family protein [Chloroflexota bacterium]
DDETPEQSIGQALTEHGLTLATMESCTGGFLANSITDVPNSSAYFKGGVVAYTAQLKIAHGVPEETINQHGCISAETAAAMAKAIREKFGADFGIGITGVAGPAEMEGKPVGQVYIAIAGAEEAKGLEMRVPPRRIVIKRRASNTALTELRKMITAGVGARG